MALFLRHVSLGVSFLFTAFGIAPAPMVTEIAPGVTMPMMILGTSVPDMKTYDNCPIQDAVEKWFKVGGRHVLTCLGKCYASEPQIGRAWKASGLPRKDIFITTMLPEPEARLETIHNILNVSLRNLEVDYIDLVLIKRACVFNGGPEYPDMCGSDTKALRLATWEGLMELRRMGKIRAAGVSNYNAEHVAEILALGEKPAVNQVEWHLGFHDDALLATMKSWNITIQGYGALSGPTATFWGNAGVHLHDPRVVEVAQRYNVSPAQLVLQWMISKGIAPITATCDESHAMQDLSAFGFALTAQDAEYLDSLEPQLRMFFV